jgi:hypothetical protein
MPSAGLPFCMIRFSEHSQVGPMDSSKIIRDRRTDGISGSHQPLQGDKQLGKTDMGIYPPPPNTDF